MQCAAKSKQSGVQCKRYAVPGKNVCATHGGKSLGGIASPLLKTGRHSKFLPTRLSERYQESLVDDSLLELNAEIALLDARLADLLTRVDTGESGAAWQAATKSFQDYRKAWRTNNTIDAFEAMQELETIFSEAAQDYTAWAEIQSIVQQRRALVESERKRRVDMQQMIDTKQALLLVGAVVGIIKARVSDRDILAAISADLNGLLAARNGAEVSA